MRQITPDLAALQANRAFLATGVRGLRNSTSGDIMTDPVKSTAEMQQRPDPNEQLVRVFESEQETEALVVKGLLESLSIESDLAPISLTQRAFPNMGGTMILVREKDAERARRLIVEYSQNQPDADEEAEETSAEEPPATT
jgi:hypothetical protein